MEKSFKGRLGSSLTQRYYNKPNDKLDAFNIDSRFSNSTTRLTNRPALFSLNNSVNIKTVSLKNSFLLDDSSHVSREKKPSKVKLRQYLDLINQMNSQTMIIQDNTKIYTSNSPTGLKMPTEYWVKQHTNTNLKKRKGQANIPYSQIESIVSKIYKYYDTILKFGYSYDQICLIIRQICSKRKNIQFLLLNKKQKPKRSYFTYEVKKESQSIQSIIKQAVQNLNGKFEIIFRDLNNFCIFLQQEIIDRGCNRIKQIKKSVLHLKAQLEVNQYSQQMGFNNFIHPSKDVSDSKKQEKLMKLNYSVGRKNVAKYMSSISKNIDQQLGVVENQIGDFLEQNRNFVEVLGKISRTINK